MNQFILKPLLYPIHNCERVISWVRIPKEQSLCACGAVQNELLVLLCCPQSKGFHSQHKDLQDISLLSEFLDSLNNVTLCQIIDEITSLFQCIACVMKDKIWSMLASGGHWCKIIGCLVDGMGSQRGVQIEFSCKLCCSHKTVSIKGISDWL